MSELTELLLQASNALLLPVIVALLALAALALLHVGGAVREWLERRGARSAGFRARFERLSDAGDERRERESFDAIELEIADRLGRLQLASRLGPMLGLMGTLIPLGPALMSFSDGDLEALASQLVVAFSTTVIGLFVGGVCCVILHVKRVWYAKDMAWIEQTLDARAEAVA